MNLKIGQKVSIDKKMLEKMIKDLLISKIPIWVSNDIYTIKNIDKKNNIAYLDRNLSNINTNKININYLKSIKELRKEKLYKIDNF